MHDPDVSIILPVFNENGHLVDEVARIRDAMESSSLTFEIIAIDDASTDGSGEVLAELDGIRVIRLARNAGSGNARRIGTRAARGGVVVWTDADMTYPNHEIPRLVKELDGFDQVVGARTSEQGTLRWLRMSAKWLIRRLASYLVKEPIPDLNSGFRAFRRDVAMQYVHLLPRGFSCVTTLTMTFLANGYSVKYIPIDYLPRAGQSKFHWRTDTTKYLTQVVRMVMSYEPLRIFMPIGFALAAIGLGKLGYDVATKNFRVGTNTLLVLFTAFQSFAIGFLADLVVRTNAPRDAVDPAGR